MCTRLIVGFFLIQSSLPLLAAGKEDAKPWLEIHSPHFTVITNGNEKQGRRVVERFEEIRAVFHAAFPRMRLDTSAPIIIFAAKDENTFEALEPLEHKTKGHIKIAGLFQRGPEKNLVLLRLDSDADDLYETVFHEYTHVVLNQNIKALPLWLDEGLAGFYGCTRIHEKEVDLGFPSERYVATLRDNPLIPLETLLQVGHSSPYYNQKDKGTIFYAQSWTLVHYMMIKQSHGGASPLAAYVSLVDQGVNATDAAARAFGDLKKLLSELEFYVRGLGFEYLRMKSSVRAEDLALTVRTLTLAESAAARGDFLAHIRRYDDAKTLLAQALGADASNAQARESLGYLELSQNNLVEAAKWFSEAAQLDSRSYLAHYYHAMLIQKEGFDDTHLAEAEASLQRSAELNNNFAPAYGALASVMARRRQDLKGALGLARRAIVLDPGVQGYQLLAASIQMQLGEIESARHAVELIVANAKSPEDRAQAEVMLGEIKRYLSQLQERKEAEERYRAEQEEYAKRAEEARKERVEREKLEEAEAAEKISQVTESLPAGTGKAGWSAGKIASVNCKEPPGLELTLQGALNKLRLHAANYFKIEFKASAWQAPEDFDPCRHLLGRSAAISFRSFEGSPYDGEIVSVEVRK